MTAAELAALPDALWERYCITSRSGGQTLLYDGFLDAIKEAMQAVRKRDAEIVSAMLIACDAGDFGDKEYSRAYVEGVIETISAAAIESDPLP